MPTSHPSQIPALLALIGATYPQSILEIGPGVGKWGLLAREYFDISDGREKYHKCDWSCRIDCIEAFPSYITPSHEYWYDEIMVGDARERVPMLTRRYDVALLIDVLEHFTQADGTRLVTQLLQRASGLVISCPKDNGTQGAAFGNTFETHRHEWHADELRSFAPSFAVRNGRSTIVYVGSNARTVRRRYVMTKFPRLNRIAMRTVQRLRNASA
jgi:hypothetical protein